MTLDADFPEHLKDPQYLLPPIPVDGKSFRPPLEVWSDPISGTNFLSNGFGYFENAYWLIRERPGLQLEFSGIAKDAWEILNWQNKQDLRGIEESMTATKDLQAEWERLVEKCRQHGMDASNLYDLLDRICRDMKCEFGLSPESVEKLEEALNQECSLLSKVKETEEKAAAEKNEEKAKILAERTQIIFELFGKNLENAKELAETPVAFYQAILAKAKAHNIEFVELEKMHENLTLPGVDSMEFNTLCSLSEAINSAIEVRDNPGQESAKEESSLPAPNENKEEEASGQSQSEPEADAKPPAKKRTRKSTKAKQPKEAAEPVAPPFERIHDLPISNRSNGEVKTFETVMAQFHQLRRWLDYYKAKIKEVESKMHGWNYCYWSGVEEIIRQQFEYQKRPDGTFKPATVTTPFGKFSRKDESGPQCIDKTKYELWQKEMEPEEAAAYGDAVDVVCKANDKEIAKLIEDGMAIPGWANIENTDPIGLISLQGMLKPKADFSPDEKEEEKEGEPSE